MCNIGMIDRALRTLLGLLLISLVFVGPKTLWAWIGVIPLTTAIVGYCPLYTVLGINVSNDN